MTASEKTANRRADQVRDYKRTIIRDAAKVVFVEHGIDGATMRQIATEAGWTTSALYQYFESKEDLYAEVLRDSLQNLHDHVEAALNGTSSQRAQATLRALWGYYDDHTEEFDLGFYLFNGTKPVGLRPSLNRELNEMLDATVQLIAEALVADGLAPEAVAHRTAMAHTTSIFGLVLVTKTGRLKSMGRGHTPDEILDVFFSALD